MLLSVSLSREVVPGFARILLRTSLGKKHLVRPLLRTEITQVVNRRAWYDASKLTTEVLNLYKVTYITFIIYTPKSFKMIGMIDMMLKQTPLCVEGWDEALHEIARLSYETFLSPQNAEALLKAVEEMPVLVVGGVEDALVSLNTSQALAFKLRNSVRLSPSSLLVPFISFKTNQNYNYDHFYTFIIVPNIRYRLRYKFMFHI